MGFLNFLKRLLGSDPAHTPVPRRQTQAPAPQTNWPAQSVPFPSRPAVPRAAPRQPERRETKLNLDAAQFQPLPADQVRAQAMATDFTRTWQFGRRDRIPSLDARTQLIDQAMVGHGMITPEELVRIHEIGEQYEQL